MKKQSEIILNFLPLFSAALLAIGFMTLVACSKQPNQGLTVSANPQQPFLIPISTTVANGILTGPVAPYFTMNSLTLTWAGNSEFQLLAVEFYAQSLTSTTSSASGSTGTGTSFDCGGSGSIIAVLYQNATYTDSPAGCSGIATGTSPIDPTTGNVIIPNAQANQSNCSISIKSSQFFCDSLPITVSPNPFANYNIPVEVVIFGETVDVNGNTTGRVAGIGNITIQ